jgi:hypothetical protein
MEDGTWTASVEDADGQITYKWYEDDFLVRTHITNNTSDTYTTTVNGDFALSVTASSGDESDSDSKSVVVENGDGCPPICVQSVE